MKPIKLTDILREIKSQQAITINATKARTMRALTLETILNSGALSNAQTQALTEFFTFYNQKNLPLLNENTIRRIESRMLTEGFLDWIKDKGAAAKDALMSGWNNVKKIWGNFKDFVSSIIEKIKETFKKIVDYVKTKVESAISWVNDLSIHVNTAITAYSKEEPDVQKNLAQEIKDLSSCITHIATWKDEKILGAEGWSEKILDGSAVKIEGETDVKTESNIFNDKALLLTLKEAEGVSKPEDVLKQYPSLYKIVKYTIEGLKWFFKPIQQAMKLVIDYAVKSIFKATSMVSKTLGGPGIYEFAVLTFIIAEAGQLSGKKIQLVHDAIETITEATIDMAVGAWSWLTGPAKPIIDIIAGIIEGIITFLGYYTSAKIILNVTKPAIDKYLTSK